MSALCVVVVGALGSMAVCGGVAWVRLAWMRGLCALGARVIFVEELAPAARLLPGRALLQGRVLALGALRPGRADRARRARAHRPAARRGRGFRQRREGLLAFHTPGEASAAACEVARDLEEHGRAAGRIAERFFDARTVLSGFLELALEGGARRTRALRAAPGAAADPRRGSP